MIDHKWFLSFHLRCFAVEMSHIFRHPLEYITKSPQQKNKASGVIGVVFQIEKLTFLFVFSPLIFHLKYCFGFGSTVVITCTKSYEKHYKLSKQKQTNQVWFGRKKIKKIMYEHMSHDFKNCKSEKANRIVFTGRWIEYNQPKKKKLNVCCRWNSILFSM